MSPLTGEETSASFWFRPEPNPFGGSAPTLHGLTHDEVTRAIRQSPPSGLLDIRHVAIHGPMGSLSGYIAADSFDAVCVALGVRP